MSFLKLKMNNILSEQKTKKLLTNKQSGTKILFTVQKTIKDINFMTSKKHKKETIQIIPAVQEKIITTLNKKALYYALNKKWAELKKCIKQGADANMCNDQGYSLLHYSIAHGQQKIATLLLNKGAHPDIRETTLGETPLSMATRLADKNIVIELLENMANSNTTNIHGETPLMIAARKGLTSIAECLIMAGAEVNKGTETSSPLFEAIKNQNVAVTWVLLNANANIYDTKNIGGIAITPISYISSPNYPQTQCALKIKQMILEQAACQSKQSIQPITIAQAKTLSQQKHKEMTYDN